MASTESDIVEVDEPEIEQADGRKNEENTWSVTNSRIVIDFYKDNAVLYNKSHKDYGNKAVTKKVFAPLLAKMPDKTITDIKKRWHTLRSSLLRHTKKPEEEVKWLYWGRVEKTDPHSADYPLTPVRGLLYGLLRGLLYGLVRGLPCGLPQLINQIYFHGEKS